MKRSMPSHSALSKVAAIVGVSFSLTACNIYKFMDKPSSDLQILSAARACFDQGDLNCALDYYGKLSDDSKNIRIAEQAFVKLAQNNAGMKEFLQTAGTGIGGTSLNTLASLVFTSGTTAQTTRRNEIIAAYNTAANITDTNMAALVRFASMYALLGAVLGELSSDGTLNMNEIAASGSACKSSGGCAGDANCDGGVPSTAFSAYTDSPSVGLIDQIITNLKNDGNILGITNSFSSLLTTLSAIGAASPRCYRNALLTQGVGI